LEVSSVNQLEKDLLHALDPVEFAGSLGFYCDPWQAKVLRWEGRQLILNCHRQAGKSTVTSLLAVHKAIYHPDSLILLVSPTQRQSSELFRKCTEWLNRLEHKPDLPEDNKLSCALANGSRIVSLPSTEANVRGFSGPSLIIIDEAARVSDQLYFAIRPMLASSGGQLIQMSTPNGKIGFFWYTWDQGIGWDRVMVSATESNRITPEFLEEERRTMGEYYFNQEYLCVFQDRLDQPFSSEHIMRALTTEVKPLFLVSGAGGSRSVLSNDIRPLFYESDR
jgi:hypothetical protein